MRGIPLFALIFLFVLGCGLPQETRRGVGTEGFLIILASPSDAEVFIDGERIGQAGQFETNPVELKSGTHRIEIRKAGFVPEAREVYAGNQSRHILKVNLKRSP